MDTPAINELDDSIEKIQLILNVLKKQVDQYDRKVNTKLNTVAIQDSKVQRLTVKARYLFDLYRKINSEIYHYERKFEKSLKKTVKHIKRQIENDQLRLDNLKRQYNELSTEIGIGELITNEQFIIRNELIANEKEKQKQKETDKEKFEEEELQKEQVEKQEKNETKNKLKRMKRGGKEKQLRKVNSNRNNKISKLKPKFKPRISLKPSNNKVKIKIKTNKMLGKREVVFINDNNQQTITNTFKNIAPPKSSNIRECKIMVQKLTEEQIKRYIDSKQAKGPIIKQKQLPKRSSQQAVKNHVTKEPNWHIKIPQSILDEFQKHDQNSKLSTIFIENAMPTNNS